MVLSNAFGAQCMKVYSYFTKDIFIGISKMKYSWLKNKDDDRDLKSSVD